MRKSGGFQIKNLSLRGVSLSVLALLLIIYSAVINQTAPPEQKVTPKPILEKTAPTSIAPIIPNTTSKPRIRSTPLEGKERLPNFSKILDVKEKKRAFFSFLLAYVQDENRRIKRIRSRILSHQTKLRHKEPLQPGDPIWLFRLAGDYELPIKLQPNNPEFFTVLLQSVDILPASLVLAQGANESGWGGSRFARKGNNLFGQWCYIKGCGLVPLRRQAGQIHEVTRFSSVADSVRAYFKNINTHPAYAPLRRLREKMRREEKQLSGLLLAEMLIPYSQRGEAYVSSIKGLIQSNHLSKYDPSTPSQIQ
jgi:Bax protein